MNSRNSRICRLRIVMLLTLMRTNLERRGQQRLRAKIPLHIRLVSRSSAIEFNAESTDISIHGVSFITSLNLIMRERLQVTLRFPEEINGALSEVLRFEGNVVRCLIREDQDREIGVQFHCYERVPGNRGRTGLSGFQSSRGQEPVAARADRSLREAGSSHARAVNHRLEVDVSRRIMPPLKRETRRSTNRARETKFLHSASPTNTLATGDLVSDLRGMYRRIARRLHVDTSYVSRVARGDRKSEKIENALRDELNRIIQRLNKKRFESSQNSNTSRT